MIRPETHAEFKGRSNDIASNMDLVYIPRILLLVIRRYRELKQKTKYIFNKVNVVTL
jgi:hypothetical protein